jgi:hypothetical protein
MIINGKKINRIVASGCSFTYGYGLEDRATQTWVAQLSNMFNVESVNLGKEGHGNEHVQNSIVDYFFENPSHKKDSFVIPCFTAYSRIEFPLRSKDDFVDANVRTFTTILKNKKIENLKFIEIFFKEIFVPVYYYRRYLRTIITLEELLKGWDTPYIMFEGVCGNPHKEMINKVEFQKLIQLIDRTKWLHFTMANLDSLTDPHERFPDGHPNAVAYKQMAEILYKYIINSYETE